MRRVNYYVKHLIIDEEGELSKTLSWIATTVLISDLVWRRILVGLGNPGQAGWCVLQLQCISSRISTGFSYLVGSITGSLAQLRGMDEREVKQF